MREERQGSHPDVRSCSSIQPPFEIPAIRRAVRLCRVRQRPHLEQRQSKSKRKTRRVAVVSPRVRFPMHRRPPAFHRVCTARVRRVHPQGNPACYSKRAAGSAPGLTPIQSHRAGESACACRFRPHDSQSQCPMRSHRMIRAMHESPISCSSRAIGGSYPDRCRYRATGPRRSGTRRWPIRFRFPPDDADRE